MATGRATPRTGMAPDIVAALAEVFRQHGYAGTSLSLIGRATGLGKGSLYHLFPGGKAEMAACVLADIDAWFEAGVFGPLCASDPPEPAIAAMFDAVERYFQSGRRVCLVGSLALGTERDLFAEAVRGYFARWIDALAGALRRAGRDEAASVALAEEIVVRIQGAIVLARALDRPAPFTRALAALRIRVATTTG